MRRLLKKGFSLVEMLVVMGVLLILAAIMYPALSKAKETGRTAKCASNLRQLYVASMNYATDAGGYPSALSGSANGWDGKTYHVFGWLAWATWNPADGTSTNIQTGTYGWNLSDGGMATITNGTLWPYAKGKEIYLCPTFAQKSICGRSDAVRSYMMDTNASWVSFTGQNVRKSTTVLFGDYLYATNTGTFSTNTIGKWHAGNKAGSVVFMDGHVDKM